MTEVDIQQAMPRAVVQGVMECGPYFERHARGGYFMVDQRQFHWYEEVVPRGDSYLLTRDEALCAALNQRKGRE